ncbi:uncharacterized protein LOC141640795 [Silene latifolia]|uniref:uncharacterized protein LOC141640795 n=1 Tax=Silene latifolia TaxID=37657 RepID=UPI003D777ACB
MEKVSVVPIWVLFPGLDIYLWSSAVLSKMSSKIGRPMFTDIPTTNKDKLSFARVMIEVDISTNPPLEISLNTLFGPYTQRVEYEWIPHYCSSCGKMGHLKQSCKKNKPTVSQKKSGVKYIQKNTPCVLGGTSGSDVVAPEFVPIEKSSECLLDSSNMVADLESSSLKAEIHQECAKMDQLSQPQIALKRECLQFLSYSNEGEIIPNLVSEELMQVPKETIPYVLGGTLAPIVDDTQPVPIEGSSILGSPNVDTELESPLLNDEKHQECTKKDQFSQPQIALKRGCSGELENIIIVPIDDVFTPLGIYLIYLLNDIATWNIRGFNKPIKHSEVNLFLKENKVDVLGLLETKDGCSEPPIITKVDIMHETAQVVHCKVKHLLIGKEFFLSVVYGSNNAMKRLEFWDSLLLFSSQVEQWTTMGDFNAVRHVHEKISTTPVLAELMDFNFCLLRCDHCPAMLTFHDNDMPKKQFKYLNCWAEHPKFHQIVAEAGNGTHIGNSMFRLMSKLREVKKALRCLHSEHYANIADKIKDKKEELSQCFRNLRQDPTNVQFINKEKEVSKEFWNLKDIELQMLSQRAKLHNIKHNDTYSKYFFNKIKERQQHQMIGDIKDHNGISHSGMQGVGEAFFEYYKQLLGNSAQVSPIDPDVISVGACINTDDHAALIQSVTRVEIKQALFAIDSNKSPDIDGFSAGFFKKAWDIVGDDFCLAVEDFFKTGFLPKQANTTLVSLILKKPFPQIVKDIRPISCCSTIYKTISKILTARLQRIIPTIVGPEQAAFVQGKSLFENVMLTQGLLKGYGRKNITPRCMLKVDISEAFDTL